MNWSLINSCLISSLETPQHYETFLQNRSVIATQALFVTRLFLSLRESIQGYLWRQRERSLIGDGRGHEGGLGGLRGGFGARWLRRRGGRGGSRRRGGAGGGTPFRVGIIGFGDVGRHIYRAIRILLPSYSILISTRRPTQNIAVATGSDSGFGYSGLGSGSPERTSRRTIDDLGVVCTDSAWVLSRCDLCFICLLPTQLRLWVRDWVLEGKSGAGAAIGTGLGEDWSRVRRRRRKTDRMLSSVVNRQSAVVHRIVFSTMCGVTTRKLRNVMKSSAVIAAAVRNSHLFRRGTYFSSKDSLLPLLPNRPYLSFACPVLENDDSDRNLEFVESLMRSMVAYTESFGIPAEHATQMAVFGAVGRVKKVSAIVSVLNMLFFSSGDDLVGENSSASESDRSLKVLRRLFAKERQSLSEIFIMHFVETLNRVWVDQQPSETVSVETESSPPSPLLAMSKNASRE